MTPRRLYLTRRRARLVTALAGVLGAGVGMPYLALAQGGQETRPAGPMAAATPATGDTTRGRRGSAAASSGVASPDSARPTSATPGDEVTEAVREYERTGIARTVEAGAFVTFPYGHGQSTVTCAPLRACVIELDTGETVLSRIAGDTQRWEIELAPAGADGRTPLVVVKPHDCGLTTNLVLTTTAGRIYDLTLDSPPCARAGLNPHGIYARHVRFYYPDAMVQAWTAATTAPTPPTHSAGASYPAAFNFAYRIRRDRRFPWTPVAVFDDGAHCYIKLPPRAEHGEAPVLFALGDDGSKTLLNYSVTRDTYITDRVFRAAVLVLGEGGTQHVLRMDNTRYDMPPEPDPEGRAGTTSNEGIVGPPA